jgi:hypothetical protein
MEPKVSQDLCNERHRELNTKLDEMHSDIKKILTNHLPHLSILIVASLIIAGLALGVKATELLGWLP